MSAAFDETLAMRGGPARVVISQYSLDPLLQGRTLAEAAAAWHVSPFEAAITLLRGSGGHVSMIYHVLEESDVDTIFRQPFVMVASDGSAVAPDGILARDYYPHPRNYGCFPRVLGEFVRERQLVDLGEAVRKMTALPARQFRLERRGELREGWHADLTVFDPSTVADRATFDAPRAFPAGIVHVFVNGRQVIDRGEHTGDRPGTVLYGTARRSVAVA
jgi:N-acyl-D-aspartate/D-glutamate deacylase